MASHSKTDRAVQRLRRLARRLCEADLNKVRHPGVDPKDVAVSVLDGVLTVKGRAQAWSGQREDGVFRPREGCGAGHYVDVRPGDRDAPDCRSGKGTTGSGAARAERIYDEKAWRLSGCRNGASSGRVGRGVSSRLRGGDSPTGRYPRPTAFRDPGPIQTDKRFSRCDRLRGDCLGPVSLGGPRSRAWG